MVLWPPKNPKLLAMWEGGLPYAMNPYTLDTHGEDTMSGSLLPGSSFSAHPRFDAARERLVNFGVRLKPSNRGVKTMIDVFEYDNAGVVVHQHVIPVKQAVNIHDFVITENYIVIFVCPIKYNYIQMAIGSGMESWLNWDDSPKAKTRIFVLERSLGGAVGSSATAPVSNKCYTEYSTEKNFIYHFVNAYEVDGFIVVDAVVYDSMPSLDMRATGQDGRIGIVRRFRWPCPEATFDSVEGESPEGEGKPGIKRGGDVRSEVLYGDQFHSSEMVSIPFGLDGKYYRFAYMVDQTTSDAAGNAVEPYSTVVKLNVNSREVVTYTCRTGCYLSPGVFAPRVGSSSEDDGYFLTLEYDSSTRKSSLLVIDSQHFEDGPVTTLRLRSHIPFNHHIAFTPGYYGPNPILPPHASNEGERAVPLSKM
jgi:all-trans-8'-apo-beta-carotenal 15,15'-oxygenase